MATTEAGISITLPAAADLRTHQYKFVSIDANGKAALTADDAHADGILCNDPNTDEAAIVLISGVGKVKCGAAVTRGGDISSGANASRGAGKRNNRNPFSPYRWVISPSNSSGRFVMIKASKGHLFTQIPQPIQRGSETNGLPLESSRTIHSIPLRTGGQKAQHSALHFFGWQRSSSNTATRMNISPNCYAR